MTQHSVTPPPELVQQWVAQHADYEKRFNELLIEAAQWGADQELEACCEWADSFQNKFVYAHDLRLVRRPQPPSLKEQALEVLGNVQKGWGLAKVDLDTIRRAIEALPE